MTTIDTERLALGWGKIAEGAMEISLAYSAIDTPAARAGADTGAGGAKAGQPSSVPVLPTFDELPPEGFLEEVERVTGGKVEPVLNPQVEAGLGVCPVHGKHWSVKPAGVSPRTKEPYEAFYRCAEKDDDGGYCKQKPQKIWRDIHPIPGAAAA